MHLSCNRHREARKRKTFAHLGLEGTGTRAYHLLVFRFAQLVAATILAGCASGASGDIVVFLDADSTIVDGIADGDARGEIRDGWSVHFDKFIVAIGDIEIAQGEGGRALVDTTATVVDLTRVIGGVELHRFTNVEAVRWHDVSYRTPVVSQATVQHASVGDGDLAIMRARGWTHFIEGRITNTQGVSCPPEGACRMAESVRFSLGAHAPARFGFCANALGVTGIAVPSGATTTASLSIKGDHIFLNAFLTGHTNLEHLAQWLADADLNADDFVSSDELAMGSASELMPTPPQGSYSFAGSPRPVVTALDFVTGQLATLGHFQGHGECAWELED